MRENVAEGVLWERLDCAKSRRLKRGIGFGYTAPPMQTPTQIEDLVAMPFSKPISKPVAQPTQRLTSTAASLALLAFAPIALAQNAQIEEARAAAAAMARDAAARTSWSEDRGVAGYRDGHPFLSDATGDNTLSIGGYSLFRYYASLRSGNAPLTSDNEFTQGFQFNKFHIHAVGNIGQPEMTYNFALEFDSTGAASIEDAWIHYQFGETPWGIRAGQFKPAILREENVGEFDALAVERSQVGLFFNTDVSQGVQVEHTTQQFQASVSLTDGFRSPVRPSAINTPYDSTDEADYGVSVRGQWMFAGSDWSRFDHFSSFRSRSTYSGVIGAAVAHQSFGDTGASAAIVSGSDTTYTIDVTTQGSGWNAMGAFIANINDTDGFIENKTYGAVFQGGYFVADQVELFARGEWLRLDPLVVTASDHNLRFLTLGANYFMIPDSHAVKLSAEIVYALDATDGLIAIPAGDTTSGLLGDADKGEVDLRLQISVSF